MAHEPVEHSINEDHGAFRDILERSKRVVEYDEEEVSE